MPRSYVVPHIYLSSLCQPRGLTFNPLLAAQGNLLPEGEIGHAHGFRRDATYTAESGLGSGWLQDHWFRAYSGTLHCRCCNPFSATGVVDRMDAGTDDRPEQEIDLGWCEGEEKQDPLYYLHWSNY